MTLDPKHIEDLYRIIWNEIDKTRSKLIRIGGVQDHIHLLVDLHPTVALATLMRFVKSHSSIWLANDERFPYFEGWASEYFASTISPEDQDSMIEYINDQARHHLTTPFSDELVKMYEQAYMILDDRDLM